MSIWTPLFILAVYGISLGLGDVVATKTKGMVSSVLILASVFLIGYWTGIIPTEALATSNVPAMVSSVGLALIICNQGTMLDIDQLIQEWRTVVVSLAAVAGIGLICCTLGAVIFGREYAFCAAAPLSGGMVATIITQGAAQEAGKGAFGGFAMLVFAFQQYAGMPLAAYLIKREGTRLRKKGTLMSVETVTAKKFNFRFVPPVPEKYNSSALIIGKVVLVCAIGGLIANLTLIPGSAPANYYLNPNIAYLLFGVLFTAFGFLDKRAMQKAGAVGFLMFAVLTVVPGSFAGVTPGLFLDMLFPLIGMLVMGVIGIIISSVIFGKLVGYSPEISVAIGCTALLGYPATEIVTKEAAKGFEGTEEEKSALYDQVIPKMLVGGFVTVTIASVVLAGIIVPHIF